MPIPSKTAPVTVDLAPRIRRSVFNNYRPNADDQSTDPAIRTAPSAPPQPPDRAAPAAQEQSPTPPAPGHPGQPQARARLSDLPPTAPSALARSFLHQFLAHAFEYPTLATWAWISDPSIHHAALAASVHLGTPSDHPLPRHLQSLLEQLRPEHFNAFHDDYIVAIGHAARGSCPINEIEYGDLKADPLFQPHRLADLAAFYRAFGLELGPDAGERHDHLSVQLEFMAVLTAQEACAGASHESAGSADVCLTAQRKFLREHLGRWTPAFARRLQRAIGPGPLASLARFTLAFVESECRRFNLDPGSEDLLLRPADAQASLCDSCGLAQSLPGAPALPIPS